MNIRMYNCYFGDCFKISNPNGKELLVDFGIHNSCTNSFNRDQRFDDIYSDLCDRSIDFLLSHYHEDHYNGIVYVNQNNNYKFGDVYIPDIWSFNGCIQAIAIHLLRGILDKSIMQKGMTIFAFLNAICCSHSTVYFVQRGKQIQDKYIALWPSEDFIKDKALEVLEKTLDNIEFSDEERERLYTFSERLRGIVLEISSRNYDDSVVLQQIESLENEISEFIQQLDIERVERKNIVYLRNFENDISIVFQNKESLYYNLLFTGDFGKNSSLWDKIETNYDSRKDCYMHDKYHVIKVGHHGTRAYYHSFIGKITDESILMIPNGGIRNKWSICSDYSLNAITVGAQVICSTNDSCEAKNCNKGCCTCLNNIIIEPAYYCDIV